MELKYAKEIALINDYVKAVSIRFEESKVYQLAHIVAKLATWQLKEYVVRVILNKYIAIQKHNSREKISSLPAYAAAVVKYTTEQYLKIKDNIENSIEEINPFMEIVAC